MQLPRSAGLARLCIGLGLCTVQLISFAAHAQMPSSSSPPDSYAAIAASAGREPDAIRFERLTALYLAENAEVPQQGTVDDERGVQRPHPGAAVRAVVPAAPGFDTPGSCCRWTRSPTSIEHDALLHQHQPRACLTPRETVASEE